MSTAAAGPTWRLGAHPGCSTSKRTSPGDRRMLTCRLAARPVTRAGQASGRGCHGPRTSGSGAANMANRDHIRNPVEWTADQIRAVGMRRRPNGARLAGVTRSADGALPAVRRISVADLGDVLAKGLDDFAACRSDVIFLCIIYPLAGLVLAWSAVQLRCRAAPVSPGLRLRARRPGRGGRPVRDEPAPRAGCGGELGGRIRRSGDARVRRDRGAGPRTARDLPALAGDRLHDLPCDHGPRRRRLARAPSTTTSSRPARAGRSSWSAWASGSCSRCWC